MTDKLREDFPIDWEDDHFVTRREFFKFMTLASGGIAVGTTALAAYAALPKSERRFEPAFVCRRDQVRPGESLAFGYPRSSDLCILVRRQDGEYAAFSRRCTHLSCPVVFESKGTVERLYCPCHNGAFSVQDGSVLQGPPPHPLNTVVLETRGDEIWAVGVKAGGHS
jgi:Rieske Fe-S protein